MEQVGRARASHGCDLGGLDVVRLKWDYRCFPESVDVAWAIIIDREKWSQYFHSVLEGNDK